MRGIKIIVGNAEFHTGNDLDLVQEVKNIGKPAVQSRLKEIPGRNGLLNFTKSLTGQVNYYNRQIELQYCGVGTHAELVKLDRKISMLHGETIKFIDDDTPDYYYEGECTVENTFNPGYLTIKLSISAYPFMRSIQPRRIVCEANNSGEGVDIYIKNNGRPVNPNIICNITGVSIELRGETVEISGSGIYPSLQLAPGVNVLTLYNNTDDITIEFTEERL